MAAPEQKLIPARKGAAHWAQTIRALRRRNPEPKGELNYGNNYQLLVAVVLSAQATDRSVNLATRELFAAANTPAKMAALGEERLIALIRRWLGSASPRAPFGIGDDCAVLPAARGRQRTSVPIMEILILLALFVLNGVFAMSEMAVVSARRIRLQHLVGYT